MNRVRFDQNEIDDATCQLCHQANETLKRFILDCTALEPARRPALDAIQGLVFVIFDHPISRGARDSKLEKVAGK